MRSLKTVGTLVALALSAALSTQAAHAANVRWASPVSGNYGDATKWSPAVVPGPGDTAIVQVAGNYTITVADAAGAPASYSVGNFILGRNLAGVGLQTLSIPDSSSLALAGPGVSNVAGSGVFNLAGTVTGAGRLAVSPSTNPAGGMMNWTGGTVSGSGSFTVTGMLNLSGGTKTLSRALLNNGTTTWSAGDINSTTSVTNRGTFTTTTSGLTIGGAGFNFSNANVLEPVPNAPATLAITGNFDNTNVGTYNVDVASNSSFDQIQVSGTASLSGTANVRDVTLLDPADGNVFILTFGTIVGCFNSPTPSTMAGSNYNVTCEPFFQAVRLLRNLTYINRVYKSNATGSGRTVMAGEGLTVSGHDLDGATSVNFRNTATGVTALQNSFTISGRADGSKIDTTVPADLAPGDYAVSVTSNADESNPNTSNERTITVVAAPSAPASAAARSAAPSTDPSAGSS